MPICIVLEDVFSFVSPAGDVVHSAGVLNAQRSGHGASMPGRYLLVNTKDLTPIVPAGS